MGSKFCEVLLYLNDGIVEKDFPIYESEEEEETT